MGASCERDPHGDRLVPLLRAGLMGLDHVRSQEGRKGRHDLRDRSQPFLPLIDRVGMGLVEILPGLKAEDS